MNKNIMLADLEQLKVKLRRFFGFEPAEARHIVSSRGKERPQHLGTKTQKNEYLEEHPELGGVLGIIKFKAQLEANEK